MMHRFRPGFAALAFVVLAGACETPVGPGEARVSLEEALAELDVPALRPATGTFTGIGPPPPIQPSACAFDAASESFVCAPIQAAGLTLAQSFTLISEAGAKQSSFDRTTTSWLRTSATIRGTVIEAGKTIAVDGEQELVMTGLLTDRHTINGSSTTRRVGVMEGVANGEPVSTTVTTKFKKVVIPVRPPGSQVPWPLSGSMEMQTTVFADYPAPYPGPGPMVSGVVVVFTGTALVEVALTDRQGTRACHVHMLLAQGLGCRS
jgi:hypothetical protein